MLHMNPDDQPPLSPASPQDLPPNGAPQQPYGPQSPVQPGVPMPPQPSQPVFPPSQTPPAQPVGQPQFFSQQPLPPQQHQQFGPPPPPSQPLAPPPQPGMPSFMQPSMASQPPLGSLQATLPAQPSTRKWKRPPLVVSLIILAALGIVIFEGLASIGRSVQDKSDIPAAGTTTSTKKTVSVSCYNYSVPKGYEGKAEDGNCSSSVNTSADADELTAVKVSALTTEVTGDPVALLKPALEAQGATVTATKTILVDGITAAQANFTDTNGLAHVYVLVPVRGKVWLQDGKELHSFSISAYTSTDGPSEAMQTVIKSFHYKAPTTNKQNV